MRVGGQRYAPAFLPPGKTRYPLYRRLSGPQGRFGQVRKIKPPTGIRSPDLQPVASRYIPTELSRPWAYTIQFSIMAHKFNMYIIFNL